MVLTREKKKKEKNKNYTSNQKRKRCEFRAKIPAFYRRLQLAAPLRRHSTRKVFLEACFSHKKCERHLGNWSGIVSFVLLSMKKTVESRQNNSGRWESERDVSSSCDFF